MRKKNFREAKIAQWPFYEFCSCLTEAKDEIIFSSLHLISLERQQDFLASHESSDDDDDNNAYSPPEVHEKNSRNDHVTYSHSTNCSLILSRLLFAPNVMHFFTV